ncbi:MAG: aldolase [Candidatus Marsarchaeota archaeon]|nr:aldolase [Candidatus Marsarchaeota archaeon]
MRTVKGIDEFLTDGRSILLAYDQGLEHGPTDFNEKNLDPAYIMEIAEKGGFNGVIFQKGVAEKYYDGRVPLIIKVNGKANLYKGEPVSKQICSVEEAVSLGAKAVGYTIYLGSQFEADMFAEFGKLHEDARKYGLPVIAWIYPRGAAIKNDTAPEIVAYAARTGLELGADAVKIKYTGDPKTFSWAVRNAGKVKVYMSGGPKAPTEHDFLMQVEGAIQAGATGLAVGRNVWQSEDPVATAKRLRQIVIEGKRIEQPAYH